MEGRKTIFIYKDEDRGISNVKGMKKYEAKQYYG